MNLLPRLFTRRKLFVEPTNIDVTLYAHGLCLDEELDLFHDTVIGVRLIIPLIRVKSRLDGYCKLNSSRIVARAIYAPLLSSVK